MGTYKIETASVVGETATLLEVEATAADKTSVEGVSDYHALELRTVVRVALRRAGVAGHFRVVVRRPDFSDAPPPARLTGLGLPIAVAVLGAAGKLSRLAEGVPFAYGDASGTGEHFRPAAHGALAAAYLAEKRHAGAPILLGGAGDDATTAAMHEFVAVSPCHVETLEDLLPGAAFPAPVAVEKADPLLAAIRAHRVVLLVSHPSLGATRAVQAATWQLEPWQRASVALSFDSAGMLLHVPKERPLRAPHTTISGAALLGGGSPPRLGEVSLARHGILLLDQVHEFRRSDLEALGAMLKGGVAYARHAGANVPLSALDVRVVATTWPCPCGWRGSSSAKACLCTQAQVDAFWKRLPSWLTPDHGAFLYDMRKEGT